MEHIVGIGDMKVSNQVGDIIVAPSICSGIGLVVYDPEARVGGILHYILTDSSIDEIRAKNKPHMFADTGIPTLFKQAYLLGAEKTRIRIFVAGGAQIINQERRFNIGQSNYTALTQILTRENIAIWKQAVGGNFNRTAGIDITTGHISLKTSGKGEVEL
ncbi:MAG: chemotaxis protein CheD [Desulfobacterales bacterium]|nr:chemotaxis protein CheD [Desulfobacterales bacterium]